MTPRTGTIDGWKTSGWPLALWLSLAILALRLAAPAPADQTTFGPWTATPADSAFGRLAANLAETDPRRPALIEAAASRADARPGHDGGAGLPAPSASPRLAATPFNPAPSPPTDGRAGKDSHSAFRARAPPASA